MSGRVLYLVVCAAGPASRIAGMVKLAQDDGWEVYCIATQAAVEHFLDLSALAELTGHPVRTGYRQPGDAPLPDADAVIVAPATYCAGRYQSDRKCRDHRNVDRLPVGLVGLLSVSLV